MDMISKEGKALDRVKSEGVENADTNKYELLGRPLDSLQKVVV